MAARYDKQVAWVLDYLVNKDYAADACTSNFHDGFADTFKVKQRVAFYGAWYCAAAMRVLKRMYDDGYVTRRRYSTGEYRSGFPKWTWVYEVPEHMKHLYKQPQQEENKDDR